MVEPIKHDLGLTDTQMSLLMGLAFGIFYTLMGVPLGRLADRISRRALIATGVGVWCLMTASCGLARNFGQLFVARIGVGVGEAALTPAALSMISDYLPARKARRGHRLLQHGNLARRRNGHGAGRRRDQLRDEQRRRSSCPASAR